MRSDLWTEDQNKLLTKLWNERQLSQSQIGVELGVSQSAIAGKVDRLGLEKRGGPRTGGGPRIGRPKNGSQLAFDPRKNREVRPLPAEPVARSTKHNCDILSLTNHSCRWPIGDPGTKGFCFCGSPTADLDGNRPYCQYHAKLAACSRSMNEHAAQFLTNRLAYLSQKATEKSPFSASRQTRLIDLLGIDYAREDSR